MITKWEVYHGKIVANRVIAFMYLKCFVRDFVMRRGVPCYDLRRVRDC